MRVEGSGGVEVTDEFNGEPKKDSRRRVHVHPADAIAASPFDAEPNGGASGTAHLQKENMLATRGRL